MTTLSVWLRFMELKERLKQLIDERGLSQTQVARMAGLSTAGVCNIISGRRTPRHGTLTKLANSLGVPIEDLSENPEATLPRPVQRFFLYDWPNLPDRDKDLLLSLIRLLERANHKRQYTAPAVSPAVVHARSR